VPTRRRAAAAASAQGRLRGLCPAGGELGESAPVHGLRPRRLPRLEPNRHARAHFEGIGRPVIRSAMPGDDWWFCFPDELTVRQEPDGRVVPIDLWWETGISTVRRLLAEQPAAELTAGARAANGFPVGDWAEQQR